MRAFLLKVLGFVLIVAAGYFSLFLLVIALNVRAADKSCHLGPDVTAVMLGDSHAMWSVDDEKIPGLRNIALNAEGYKYSYLKLKRVLAQEPNVKRVYLGAGYHNLSAYYDDYIFGGSFKFFAHRYLPVLSGKDYAELFAKDPLEFLRLTKHAIVDGFKPGLKGQCELYGTFPDEKQEQVYDPKSMAKRVQSQFFDHDKLLGVSSSNLDHLEAIVSLCREKGVSLTLVNTPIHDDYGRAVPAQFRQQLSDFVRTHQLEYYDFGDFSLPDSAFLPDGDHLNYLGAMLTSEKFRAYHQAH
jgi:hypothetical protein